MSSFKVALPDGTVKTIRTEDLLGGKKEAGATTAAAPPSGIAFLSSKDWMLHAVLKSLRINAIVSGGPQVQMESSVDFVFQNPHSTPMEAVFQFRGADSTIFGFDVRIGNRHIRSECHERSQGLAAYDDAISAGARAAILEQNYSTTSLSIGNLEPLASCSVSLRLVVSLTKDRLTGAWRIEMPLASLIPQAAQVDLSIALSSPAHSIACTSGHVIRVSNAEPATTPAHVITLAQDDSNSQERELVVTFLYDLVCLETPSPIVELSESSNTAAVQFSFVPRFDEAMTRPAELKSSSEVVFLVDRSGSMKGGRMQGAVNALQAMVRSLPFDSFFQIVSFGTKYSLLFQDGSRAYSEETLALATQHIAGMEADLGGTEILAPLLDIVGKPCVGAQYVRHVVVLTDGEVGSIDKLAASVHSACRDVRVTISTVGIGMQTQGIRALVHHGLWEMVDEGAAERVEAAVALLLKKLLLGGQTMRARVSLEWDADIAPLFVTPQAYPMLWSGETVSCSAIIPGAFTSSPRAARIKLSFENGTVQQYGIHLDASLASRGQTLHRTICSSLMGEFSQKVPSPQLLALSISLGVLTRHTVLVAIDEVVEHEYGKEPIKMLPKHLVEETFKSSGNGPTEKLIDSIAQKIGIQNSEEYGIQLPNGRWLQPRLSLLEQGVTESTQLSFKKRFFCDDRNVDKSDPVQLHLVFVESRNNVVSQKMPVSPAEATNLAGIQLQAEIGNFDPAIHTETWWKARAGVAVPSSLASQVDWRDVRQQWQKLVGMTQSNSCFRYVQQCRQSPLYGMTTFPVRTKKGDQVLGITRDAIIHIDPKTNQVTRTIPLAHVRRWAAGTGSFTLDYGQYASEFDTVVTKDGEEMSQVLSGYIDIILKRQREGSSRMADVDEGELAKIEEVSHLPVLPKISTRERRSKKEAVDGVSTAAPPLIECGGGNGKVQAPLVHPKAANSGPKVAPVTPSLGALVVLQQFHGNWRLDESFASVIGIDLAKALASLPSGVSTDIWATVLALAVLQHLYSRYVVEWELLAAKARSFVETQQQHPFAQVLLLAEQFIMAK